MSDQVAEIIEELILTAPLDDIPSEEDRENAAKQIRQQIGKELLDAYSNKVQERNSVRQYVLPRIIREVCQLENDHE